MEILIEKYNENNKLLESRTSEIIKLKSAESSILEELKHSNENLQNVNDEKLVLAKQFENLENKFINSKQDLKILNLKNEELERKIIDLQEINLKNERIGQENQEIYLAEIENLEGYKNKWKEVEERRRYSDSFLKRLVFLLIFRAQYNLRICNYFEWNQIYENFSNIIEKRRELFGLEMESNKIQGQLLQHDNQMKESITAKIWAPEKIIQARTDIEELKEINLRIKQKMYGSNN